MNEQEIEVKFYVWDLKKVEMRLLELKARLIQPRVHEINYRYDLPDGSFQANGRVLRLRKDNHAYLTYKEPGTVIDGIFSHPELEFTVSDFEITQKFLGALGYLQIMIYEKYRAIYEIDDCHIMLDELPHGDFVEIECPDTSGIRKMTSQLGLNFEAAISVGYVRIYEIYINKYGLPSSDLTFDALREKKPTPEELDIRAAD